jgi:hypothetical protein
MEWVVRARLPNCLGDSRYQEDVDGAPARRASSPCAFFCFYNAANSNWRRLSLATGRSSLPTARNLYAVGMTIR